MVLVGSLGDQSDNSTRYLSQQEKRGKQAAVKVDSMITAEKAIGRGRRSPVNISLGGS